MTNTRSEHIQSLARYRRFLDIIGWIVAIVIISLFIYCSSVVTDSTILEFLIDSRNFILAIVISLTVYNCHVLESGGVIRWATSLEVWQPISKLCLGVYTMNFIFTSATKYTHKYHDLPSMLERNLKDISITLLMSIIFYIGIEAPIACLMTIFWDKLEDMKTEKNYEKLIK
jgi:hypothetical protein